jgi:hypothetical protein
MTLAEQLRAVQRALRDFEQAARRATVHVPAHDAEELLGWVIRADYSLAPLVHVAGVLDKAAVVGALSILPAGSLSEVQ